MPRKPRDASNPVEIMRASREGRAKGVPKLYLSPASRAASKAHLKKGSAAQAAIARSHRSELEEAKSFLSYKQTLAEHIRAIGEETIDAVGPDGERIKWRRIDAVIRRLYADAISGKTPASQLLFERGWGKVPMPVQVDLKAEITQLMQTTGLSIEDVANDPVLSEVARAAGIIEGTYRIADKELEDVE